MREFIWKYIAIFLAKPLIAKMIIAQAKKRPYKHIGEYMSRYWIFPESWRFPFAIRVNHIRRHDLDLYLHDHPFDWRTIILDGWYFEEDVFGLYHYRGRGETKSATAETFHRITKVSDDGVWTLFITGRRRNKWGFMINDYMGIPRKIHHSDFISPNGRAE